MHVGMHFPVRNKTMKNAEINKIKRAPSLSLVRRVITFL